MLCCDLLRNLTVLWSIVYALYVDSLYFSVRFLVVPLLTSSSCFLSGERGQGRGVCGAHRFHDWSSFAYKHAVVVSYLRLLGAHGACTDFYRHRFSAFSFRRGSCDMLALSGVAICYIAGKHRADCNKCLSFVRDIRRNWDPSIRHGRHPLQATLKVTLLPACTYHTTPSSPSRRRCVFMEEM